MTDGPVLVQRQREAPKEASRAASTIFQGFNITDSTAHVGHNYVSHNHYYEESLQRMALDELSKLHYHQVHEKLQHDRLADTGSWFLESDAYLKWRDGSAVESSRTHSIWCPGPPGVGKTFLASNIIDDLRERIQGQKYALAYFYANRDRGFDQDVSSYLGSLARQLVESVPLPERPHVFSDVKAHSNTKDSRTQQALLKLLGKLTSRFERVYVVLDALNVFSDDFNDRLRLIEALLAFQHAAKFGIIRICLTSQPSRACEQELRPQWTARIESSPEDLRAFIWNQIDTSSRLASLCRRENFPHRRPGGLKKQISDRVLKSCGGVFQIASLQMDAISKKMSRAGIVSALTKLTTQTDFYYQQAFERIERKEDFGPLAKRMLGWLLTLHESLTEEELAQAMGIETDTPLELSPNDLEVHLPTLIEMSEGFVTSYPSKRLPVTFTQESGRAFLESKLVTHGDIDWNADIARTYMRFMCLRWSARALDDTCEELFEPPNLENTPHAWYSLVLKAAQSWPVYARAAKEDLSSAERDFSDTLRQRVQVLVLCCVYDWGPIVRALAKSEKLEPCEPAYRLFSPLHIAVSVGQRDVVHALLESTAFDVNSKGIGFKASDSPPKQSSSLSLSHRRPQDLSLTWRRDYDEPSTYMMRIFRWDTACVLRRQLAVEEQEDERLSSEIYSDLVARHGRRGALAVIDHRELLHRAQTEPPLTDEYIIQTFGNPPLHLAVDSPQALYEKVGIPRLRSQRHDSDTLGLFLGREEVNVNAVGFAGFTPLLVAIRNSDVEAVRALLEHQAIDVNLVTRSDHALSFMIHRLCFQRCVSPAKQAILSGLEEQGSGTFDRLMEILRMLLEHPSMDVNRPDASGFTAQEWLHFYSRITSYADVRAFADSKRDWVGSTGRDTVARILEFYEECHLPLDGVYKLLKSHGGQRTNRVALDDWLKWFCPLPQRVFDEVSDPEVAKRRVEQGNVDEIYFLRVPFADGGGPGGEKESEGVVGEQKSP